MNEMCVFHECPNIPHALRKYSRNVAKICLINLREMQFGCGTDAGNYMKIVQDLTRYS